MFLWCCLIRFSLPTFGGYPLIMTGKCISRSFKCTKMILHQNNNFQSICNTSVSDNLKWLDPNQNLLVFPGGISKLLSR